MRKIVLLVIDVQKGIVTDRLYRFPSFIEAIKKLINCARENGIELIYVRHDDGPGGELEKGCANYEIYKDFEPFPCDKIIDKKANSAFKDTGLLEYLREKKAKELIISGLQTEYCIDATVKSAFEQGFTVIVPGEANTTIDNPYLNGEMSWRYYNEFIWKGRYAHCLSLCETLEKMRQNAKWKKQLKIQKENASLGYYPKMRFLI